MKNSFRKSVLSTSLYKLGQFFNFGLCFVASSSLSSSSEAQHGFESWLNDGLKRVGD